MVIFRARTFPNASAIDYFTCMIHRMHFRDYFWIIDIFQGFLCKDQIFVLKRIYGNVLTYPRVLRVKYLYK